MRVLIVPHPQLGWRHLGRTERALAHTRLAPAAPHEVRSGDAAWIVQAGAWPARATFTTPPRSASGRPLCALGAVVPEPGGDETPATRAWREHLSASGGDLDGGDLVGRGPTPASVYLEPPLARICAQALAAAEPFAQALTGALRETRARLVRVALLDVHDDPRLRVAQVVTSLQRGGAERVAIDLVRSLPALGIRTSLVALARPTRAPFPAPPHTFDLSQRRFASAAARDRSLSDVLVRSGTDLVHGHLIGPEVVGALAGARLPVVLTIHNQRPGWPAGTDQLTRRDAVLLIACSRAVERELVGVEVDVPVRTVWNGIDLSAHRRTDRESARREWRARLAIATTDLVLLALANPRPQKRLERLPSIVAATAIALRERGVRRDVHLVIAGEPAAEVASAQASVAALEAEVERLGLHERVHCVGAVAEPATLLAAADVLVSASAHEGLSLAQLEALAADVPVVATDAGGGREVAARVPGLHLVPVDAPPERFAAAVVAALAAPVAGASAAVAQHFSLARMAEHHAHLYPRAVARARRQMDRRPRAADRGLLLVTNNFSVGGAQSSARRLLAELRADGVPVRAAVLQEDARQPTPGLRALTASGIEVLVLPSREAALPERAVHLLLDQIDAAPPGAVVLWNVIPEYKLLIADQLLDVPLYDVSPGEMFYESLARAFARPRPGLPYASAAEYGERLAGVIVKYAGERPRAEATLRAPVHVIPNGVPVPLEPVRREPREPGEPGARLRIGTMARLHPHKGLDQLLDALRHARPALPPHVLAIAGGPDLACEAHARALAEAARDLDVQWLGDVPDPTRFLDSLDLFVLVAEPAGCPNASLEAMARGLPLILTDRGGAAEQVIDGGNGRLVPRGDVPALAAALVELASDASRRIRMGRESHALARERFTVERMARAYRRVCLQEAESDVRASR